MHTRYLKILTVASALFFLPSCAVFVGDGGHRHRGHWRRHSSLQRLDPSAAQMTAQKSETGESMTVNGMRFTISKDEDDNEHLGKSILDRGP